MTEQLKGLHRPGEQWPQHTAKYSGGPHPELLKPKKDQLDRSGEQTQIRYARPTVGKIQRQPDGDGLDYMTRAERNPQ